MTPESVVGLQIFTGCLFLAYGCWALWETSRIAERRGNSLGHARGYEEGNDHGWRAGLEKGQNEGRLKGIEDGYETGFRIAESKYKPWRAGNGCFMRRAE